ncbi:MAG: pilus assembly protein [Propionibacteriaceae bacterium]|nr:pilus assembly protein [Propionibacteriaceae bacterium]
MRRVHDSRSERGSAAVEITLLAPLLAAFILVVLYGGRLALARQAVQAAAFDAARAASLARTPAEARTQAALMAAATLANQQLPCASTHLDVDVTGFAKPAGTPAIVTVRLACDVPAGDLPGLPATVRVEQQATSALDTFRGRR